jgi:hypothetical protein
MVAGERDLMYVRGREPAIVRPSAGSMRATPARF